MGLRQTDNRVSATSQTVWGAVLHLFICGEGYFAISKYDIVKDTISTDRLFLCDTEKTFLG
jgi:hypothetical protein